MRSEHQKAVVYFQRALSLDPQYLSAWILMGHEFIELQNSNAAIQCYRQAIGKQLDIININNLIKYTNSTIKIIYLFQM